MPTKKTSQPKTTARKTTARNGARAATNGATATEPRSRRGGSRQLVIVESPAKARTIQGILGNGYDVTASVGHVRDLPKSKLGVDVDNDFEPHYIVPREKKEILSLIHI